MSKLLLERFLVFAVCFTLPHIAAASSPSKPETLTIFVKGATENMEVVRGEVARLLEPAGFAVEWKSMSDRRVGEDYPRLATVEFRGNCAVNVAVPPAFGTGLDVRSLASTAVVDGQVLPFATVHCDALRRTMALALSAARREVRAEMFGRAAARVLAHEFFHVIAQTKSHGAAGVAKACFGVADLTAERFEFDSGTLAQMRPVEPVEFELEDVAGR